MNQNKLVSRFIISTFVALYTLVSVISTIHVIDFFELSNPYWLAVILAIGFELGAAASLASLVILDKMNKTMVWALFIMITLMQMQGNMYYAFTNLEDFQSWSELFNLMEEEVLYQKRILAFVSGAILPLVALGFIKSLVDYIKPAKEIEEDEFTPDVSSFSQFEEKVEEPIEEKVEEPVITEKEIIQATQDLEKWSELVLGKGLKDEIEDELLEDDTEDWDTTTNDGLEDEYTPDLQHEPVEDSTIGLEIDLSDFEEAEEDSQSLETEVEWEQTIVNPTSVGAIIKSMDQDIEELSKGEESFEGAKRRIAKEKMQEFLNQQRNGSNTEV